MTTAAIVGGTCFIFAAGVIAGRVSGTSWRWSSVYTITNMAVLGSLVALINRFVTTRYLSILAGAFWASQALSMYTSTYFANRVDQKSANSYQVSLICVAALFATVVCGDFISDSFLLRG